MKKFRFILASLFVAIVSLASCNCGNEESSHECAGHIACDMAEIISENLDNQLCLGQFAFTVPDSACGYMQRNGGGYTGLSQHLKSGRTTNHSIRKIESSAVIKNGKMADGSGKLYNSSSQMNRFPSGLNSENHHFIALGKIII